MPHRTILEKFGEIYDKVDARYYTGLTGLPEHEGVRVMTEALPKYGFTVITKKAKVYADGKIKANMDVEIGIDMVSFANEVDAIVLFSGDGDFCYPVRLCRAMGVGVHVIADSSITSRELVEECDTFTDLASFLTDWFDAVPEG